LYDILNDKSGKRLNEVAGIRDVGSSPNKLHILLKNGKEFTIPSDIKQYDQQSKKRELSNSTEQPTKVSRMEYESDDDDEDEEDDKDCSE
jgi:hypothetical protein